LSYGAAYRADWLTVRSDEAKSENYFFFKTGKTATETFQLETGLQRQFSLVHGFLSSMQDFGAAVKISEIMSAVEHQQAFERPT
jgi:hypothetical protein